MKGLRSAARLSPEMMEEGYVLACQTVVQGDLGLTIPAQEKIDARLRYDPSQDHTIRKYFVEMDPPSLGDSTYHDEWMSAMFLPHTHMAESPSFMELLREE